jgi:D-sedoheptulose 7-phosphate isomerase
VRGSSARDGGPRRRRDGALVTAAAALEQRVGELLARRTEANARFFDREAERIARLCAELAGRFERGGRLLAVGGTPQAWSDAHHVAVEFVHPVIVGKRALPALAVGPEDVAALAGPEDAIVSFEPLEVGGERFEAPGDDPFVHQELAETLYHVLWELVHVCFEHLGAAGAGGGASSFLYPFLDEAPRGGGDALLEDLRRSTLAKAEEVGELRARTLTDGAGALVAAARAIRARLDAGGAVLAFGNGGSATDAADLVADLRAAPQRWPARAALDLSGDAAILTALANDVGPEVLFARQVLAYGREHDVVVAITTSGGSRNVVEALAAARRRGLATVALVGYDGGRIAAEGLADHVVVSPSEHVPRIQEAQASAYHVLRELLELAG